MLEELTADRAQSTPQKRELLRTESFWVLSAILVVLGLIHYLTPQIRWLSTASHALGRPAVERILFVLPIAGATFAFGYGGGMAFLALSVAIMLPRVIFISPHPVEAAAEMTAVATVGALMVWMIETQEREKRLRQEAVRRMRALNAVVVIAAESLETDQILSNTLEKIIEVTALEAGCVYLHSREKTGVTQAVHRGFSDDGEAALVRFGLGERLLVRLRSHSQDVIVLDDIQQDVLAASPLGEQGFRSLVVVPLTFREVPQGVMAFVSSRPRFFVRNDIHLLTTIAQQVGVAVENARLHHDVARQLRIQQRLTEVAEQITSELELERLLPKVLGIAKALVGANGGVIALLDQDSQSLTYPYLDNLPEELSTVSVSSDDGLAGTVVRSGRPVIVEDYPAYERAIPAFVEAGVKSAIAVPILSGDELYGVLALANLHDVHQFSQRNVATLGSIGRQAGIAIKNAHLYENFRYYVQEITRAQEEERKRIARELHDDTVQSLIALSRHLERLLSLADRLPGEALEGLEALRRMTQDMIQSVRRFSRDLRPSILDHLGLLPALESLMGDVAAQGIEPIFNVSGEKRRLASQTELILFRIIQEALSNTRRHARASRVSVSLVFSSHAIQITVEDNGRGFTPPALTGNLAASGKLGLIGMAERARLLEGTFEVQSQPGHGTRVFVEVPIRASR